MIEGENMFSLRTKNFFLLITFNFVHGAVQKLKFKRFGISTSLEGIQCAIERYDKTRLVKFDTTTGKCATLQDDWLIDKRVEKDENYFVQFMYEPIFEPTSNEFWDVPQTFGIGSSVVAYLNTRTLNSASLIALRFVETFKPILYHISLGFRYQLNRITINTNKNGVWDEEVRIDYEVKKENTDFKVEFAMRDSYFEVYVNENSIYNLTYRYPIQRPPYFWCESNYKSECWKIQYHFPFDYDGLTSVLNEGEGQIP